MNRAILVSIIALILIGCSRATPTPIIVTVEITKPPKHVITVLVTATTKPESHMTAIPFEFTKGPQTVPKMKMTNTATLICEDCRDAGMNINVWASPDRSGLKTVAQVPHGTHVNILGSTIYDGVKYYKIQVSGATGYVRDWFIDGYSD